MTTWGLRVMFALLSLTFGLSALWELSKGDYYGAFLAVIFALGFRYGYLNVLTDD